MRGNERRGRASLSGLIPWVAAWAVLTTLGSWTQFTLWHGADHLDGPLASEIGRAIASLIVVPTQAFSVAMMIVFGTRLDGSALAITLSVGLGWACVLGTIWFANWIRARMGRAFARRGRASLDGAPDRASSLTPMMASRRAFLLDGPLAIGGAAGAMVGAHSVVVEPFDLRIERYKIPVRNLPAGLCGLRLVQISDTHLGPHVPPEFVERVVRESIQLRPDVYLLTGDYVHRGTACNQRAAELFAPLVATGRPVIGVLGNHDWFGDGRDMSARLVRVGVRMIDNGRVFIDARTRALREDVPPEGVCVAGLGDFGHDVMDVDAALAGVPQEMVRIVLQHQPDAVETAAFVKGPRMDVVFAGHTHGGQIRLPLIGAPVTLSRYGQKYATGLAQGPRCPVVVSRGIGMSFLPVRIGVRPEIVEVTLVGA